MTTQKTKPEKVPRISAQDVLKHFSLPPDKRALAIAEATEFGPISATDSQRELRNLAGLQGALDVMVRDFNLQHEGTIHEREWVERGLEDMHELAHDIQFHRLVLDMRSDPGALRAAKRKVSWLKLSREEQQARLGRMREGRREKARDRRDLRRGRLTDDKLIARHKARSKRARLADERSNSKIIINPAKDNAPVEKWYDNPGRYDVKNIDTVKLDLSKLTPEQRLERTRRQMAKQRERPSGKKAKAYKRTRIHSDEVLEKQKQNVGFQAYNMRRSAHARGFELDEEFDFEHELDPTLTYGEQWENLQSNIKSRAMGYSAPEWAYIEGLPPRKRHAFFMKVNKAGLLRVARPFGGTSRMSKEELVRLVIRKKAWRGTR